MTISVIIPIYNEARVIVSCLESLQSQSRKFELILIDDGSTDQTVRLVKNYISKFSEIKIIEQKHAGPGAARNRGVSKAKGEILVFVDSDMTFAKDFLEKLVRPIETHATKGTFTLAEFVANWDYIWARCWNTNLDLPEKRRLNANYPSTAPVFRAILKSEFIKARGFTTGIGWTDDWSLSRKLGYPATATEAICYHKNPESLVEVYFQAKWMGKNEFYTKNIALILFNSLRYSLGAALIVGIIKSALKKQPQFLFFKVIYNFGISMGLLQSFFTDKNK